jgi:hypothetical protein
LGKLGACTCFAVHFSAVFVVWCGVCACVHVADGALATDVPSDHRVEALFVLCVLLDSVGARRACMDGGLVPLLLQLCSCSEVRVQAWACLAVSRLCDGSPECADAVMGQGPVTDVADAMDAAQTQSVRAALAGCCAVVFLRAQCVGVNALCVCVLHHGCLQW